MQFITKKAVESTIGRIQKVSKEKVITKLYIRFVMAGKSKITNKTLTKWVSFSLGFCIDARSDEELMAKTRRAV
jgi:hypothetical protein